MWVGVNIWKVKIVLSHVKYRSDTYSKNGLIHSLCFYWDGRRGCPLICCVFYR